MRPQCRHLLPLRHHDVEPLIERPVVREDAAAGRSRLSSVVRRRRDQVRAGTLRPRRIYNWMENVRDWCISRQLWWGHRIPAWYCDDCGHITVSAHRRLTSAKCGSQEHPPATSDVLDTWFSSALWPFSTLGWPDKTEDLDYFYPTSTAGHRLRHHLLLGRAHDLLRHAST